MKRLPIGTMLLCVLAFVGLCVSICEWTQPQKKKTTRDSKYRYESYPSHIENTTSPQRDTKDIKQNDNSYSDSIDSYNEGYDDSFENENIDYDRYETDQDYADGVDEGQEDYDAEEEGEYE